MDSGAVSWSRGFELEIVVQRPTTLCQACRDFSEYLQENAETLLQINPR
jgi:hypothetical protein